mgnify:FL=1
MFLMIGKMNSLYFERKASMMITVVISLILGLIVVTLLSFFVYQEVYEGEGGAAYDVYKRGITNRYIAIERLEELKGGWAGELGETYPFSSKCRTKIVTIDYKNYSRALEEIGYEIVSCHNLYGEARHPLYSDDLLKGATACFICSRIRFENDVIDFYSEELLNVGDFLLAEGGFFNGKRKTYYNYLYENQQNLSELFGGDLEEGFLEVSRFNVREGDIYVYYRFKEADKFDFRSWFAVTEFRQLTGVGGDPIDKMCELIETVP